MFTMAKIKDTHTVTGAVSKSNYLEHHLIHNDYYSENEKVTGEWQGKIAEELGLIDKEIKQGDTAFELLRKNINPLTGDKLTPRYRKDGIRFFDFQCSAQKSVSIMAVTFQDDRLRQAHQTALKTALKEMEKFAACRDNSSPGVLLPSKITGKICAAVFHHDASRALDPQIHSHVVIANVTYDSETGRMVALQEYEMVKAIRYCGKVYQNRLAVEVRKCGYEIEEKINQKGIIEGFEITRIPEDILKMNSKRRAVIEDLMKKFEEKNGRKPTTEEIHIITKESRDKKLSEITTQEVIQKQLEQYSPDELKLMNNILSESRQNKHEIENTYNNDDLDHNLNHALGHLFQNKSVLKGNEILAEAINQGLGSTDIEELKNRLRDNEELVNLKIDSSNPLLSDHITTKTGLFLEKWAVEKINKTKNSFAPINPEYSAFTDDSSIHKEKTQGYKFACQRQVVEDILKNKDQFMSLQGVAGSGKTSSLKELYKGMKKDVFSELKKNKEEKFLFLAPTRAAVNVLRKEGFQNSTTVAMFMQENLVGSTNHKAYKGGYIVIDEAGLLSNVSGTNLMKIAIDKKMRMLFVGDTKQHKSVAAGDFLRILETHSDISTTQLVDIIRQKNVIYRLAVEFMSKGNAAMGILTLDEKLGWVSEDKGEYLKKAADDYMKYSNNGTAPHKCLCVTPTHRENDLITEDIRTRLKEATILNANLETSKQLFRDFNLTSAQKRNIKTYKPGQSIVITATHGCFKKFEHLSVDKVIRNGKSARVLLSDGRKLSIGYNYNSFIVGESVETNLCPGDKIIVNNIYNKYNLVTGNTHIIESIDADKNIMTRDGTFIPNHFSCYKHGYAVTSHKSQGVTSENVVVAGTFINKDTAYVATSRGVKNCRIHVPDKKLMYKQVDFNTDRLAALDLIDKALDKQKTIELNRSMIKRNKFWVSLEETIKRYKEHLMNHIQSFKKITTSRKEAVNLKHESPENTLSNDKKPSVREFLANIHQHTSQEKNANKNEHKHSKDFSIKY